MPVTVVPPPVVPLPLVPLMDDVVPFAVSEMLSRSHWLASFRAENSSVELLPVAVTV